MSAHDLISANGSLEAAARPDRLRGGLSVWIHSGVLTGSAWKTLIQHVGDVGVSS